LLPESVKGQKFRIQASDVLEAQFKQLGASPQKMAFAEVYQGLQTGVVDGQENTWSNIYSKKFHEVQDTILETNHGVIDYMVVANKGFWDKLSPKVRLGLEEAMLEATIYGNSIAEDKNQEAKAKVVSDNKAKVVQLTPEQQKAWQAAMEPVWKKFEADIGQANIQAAQAANKQ
jgi:C4-dicarboxylate-binding protein DctP